MINIIVATSKNNQIGINNQLPWHIPEDLQYFKEKTKGHMVVMGRKTYESIGRPLPNRKNIVLTRDTTFKPDGVTVLHSFEQALIMCSAEHESYIIGGGEIYELFLPFTNRLYITMVDKVIEGDTPFPSYSDDFTLVQRFKGSTLTSDNCSFEFTVWDRN
ncbi:dihydrofolate reductase [Cellulosilyticum sp. I15G10I2]|uniref:dihydrofolate reductase n=1 Tax=Cellulosilyticum sp. I15G10I2 TaxID=1892843 RepID=UPI00085C753B|nr:dihydrofolate reductase [Cellulosilyticum sp. I15G10I2]